MFINKQASDDLVSIVIKDEEIQVEDVTTEMVLVVYSNKEDNEI